MHLTSGVVSRYTQQYTAPYCIGEALYAAVCIGCRIHDLILNAEYFRRIWNVVLQMEFMWWILWLHMLQHLLESPFTASACSCRSSETLVILERHCRRLFIWQCCPVFLMPDIFRKTTKVGALFPSKQKKIFSITFLHQIKCKSDKASNRRNIFVYKDIIIINIIIYTYKWI